MVGALRSDDVLRLHLIRDARLSPDGRMLAYAVQVTDADELRDRIEVRVRDVAEGSERTISNDSWVAPRWSPDGSRLAFAQRLDGVCALILHTVRDGSVERLGLLDESIVGDLAWSPCGRRIALALAKHRVDDTDCRRIDSPHFRADGIGFTSGLSQRLCTVELASMEIVTLLDEPWFYSNLEFDTAGERILFLATASPIPGASYSPRLHSLRLADRAVSEHLGEGWYIRSARWLPGANKIAVIGAFQSPITVPTTDLWVVDCATGVASCRSSAVKGRVGLRIHHDLPLWAAGWTDGLVVKSDRCAWVTVQSGGCAEIWEISLAGPERCEKAFGGARACVALNTDRPASTLLFMATDLSTPPELYIDTGRGERKLTSLNAEVLAAWPPVVVQHLEFRSTDGLELEGWFLSSALRSGPLPTIMFVHGGPFIAAGHAYRFDFHLLAAHGFGVLFANFRGSFGYGDEFAAAIMGDWGGRGFADHMGAIDEAIRAGLADPQRLGVWGASHGGFATCWIVGHTERFRAAVAEAAVTNLATAYYLSDAPDIFERDLGGKPHEIPGIYRAASPLTYAHRCKTPTLLIHGEQDLRCPIAEAEQFHRALIDADCITELVRLRDADHMGDSMGPPSTRVAQNEALLGWFKRFL